MIKNYKFNSNSVVYLCNYHVVWCSKYRRKVLTDEIDERLKEIIISVCRELNVDILSMKIMPNYVYLFLGVDPQLGVHKAVKRIKARSSNILRNEFEDLTTKLPTLWTNSYFVSTNNSIPLDEIEQYIINQKTSQRQEEIEKKLKQEEIEKNSK